MQITYHNVCVPYDSFLRCNIAITFDGISLSQAIVNHRSIVSLHITCFLIYLCFIVNPSFFPNLSFYRKYSFYQKTPHFHFFPLYHKFIAFTMLSHHHNRANIKDLSPPPLTRYCDRVPAVRLTRPPNGLYYIAIFYITFPYRSSFNIRPSPYTTPDMWSLMRYRYHYITSHIYKRLHLHVPCWCDIAICSQSLDLPLLDPMAQICSSL